MGLSERDAAFLATHPRPAMITVAPDGTAQAARAAVGLVDGRLWSSGTADRIRTRRLRRDPRCTLYVHDDRFAFMTPEAVVTILEGPDVAELSLRLFRILQDRPAGPLGWFDGELDEEAFVAAMVEEQRLIYEFEVRHTTACTENARPTVAGMDWKLELVAIPVSDVDRAKAFYAEQVGFHADHDHTVSDEIRFVQLTPPGSACSITIGRGVTQAVPGSVEGMQLVVPDVDAARAELVGRSVEVSAVQEFPWGRFVFFADPDGNRWAVQEIRRQT